MKIWYRVTITFTMLLVIFALLITGFQLAVYGDSHYGFYKKEYEKYRVTDDLNMKIDNVMAVTEHMMAYLIGKEEKLSIVTDVDGEHQDFFNEQDRFHMGEVKDLFLGGLKIRNIMLVAVLLILILLAARKADMIKLLPRAYFVTLGITGVITIVLGGLFASDFDKYFRIFHEIFFDNDQWMFDPATDYMIRMLPEGFFYDFVFRIGGFFVGSLAVLGVVSAVCIFMEKHKKKNQVIR